MDKEEKVLNKIFNVNPYAGNDSNAQCAMVRMKKERIEILKQYAQQVSRDTAVEFAEHVLNEVLPDQKILNDYVGYGGMYDLWIKTNSDG